MLLFYVWICLNLLWMNGVGSRMVCIYVIGDLIFFFIRRVFWVWIFLRLRWIRICGGMRLSVRFCRSFLLGLGGLWDGCWNVWSYELLLFCIVVLFFICVICLVWNVLMLFVKKFKWDLGIVRCGLWWFWIG